MNWDGKFGFTYHHCPRVGRHQALERDAIMLAEVVGTLRRTSLGKISWTPANNSSDRTDTGCDKVAIGQFADPNSKIDMLFEQIDHAVGQDDLDVNFGISLKEFHCYREYVPAAEDYRRRDDEVAFWRAILT